MPSARRTSMKARPTGSRLKANSKSERIYRDIRRQVGDGTLKPHDRLLSENQLAAHYKAGAYQARKAIHMLIEEGLLYAKPRSGVFVSGAATEVEDDAPSAGFYAFDMIPSRRQTLSVAVSGWDATKRRLWERIGADSAKRDLPFFLRPVFPMSLDEYLAAQTTCDLFFTTVHHLLEEPRRAHTVHPVPPALLARLPLEARHREAVTWEDRILGVPVFGTTLLGTFNTDRLSDQEQDRLQAATDWAVLFAELADLAAAHPDAIPINLHAQRTLNLEQLLILTAGGSRRGTEQENRSLDRPLVRQTLAAMQRLRHGLQPLAQDAPEAWAQQCLLYFDYTYVFGPFAAPARFQPWLFPLGPDGVYLEALGVACISGHSHWPELACEALEYLLSDAVQSQYTRGLGEHPVSSQIQEPFCAYPRAWQQVLQSIHEDCSVSVPWHPLHDRVGGPFFSDLADRFLQGDMDAEALIQQAEDRLRLGGRP